MLMYYYSRFIFDLNNLGQHVPPYVSVGCAPGRSTCMSLMPSLPQFAQVQSETVSTSQGGAGAKRGLPAQLRETIDLNYRPLHKHLYQLSGWEFVPSFREAMESGDESKMRSLLTEETAGTFCGTATKYKLMQGLGRYASLNSSRLQNFSLIHLKSQLACSVTHYYKSTEYIHEYGQLLACMIFNQLKDILSLLPRPHLVCISLSGPTYNTESDPHRHSIHLASFPGFESDPHWGWFGTKSNSLSLRRQPGPKQGYNSELAQACPASV